MIAVATEQAKEIQLAYDLIKRAEIFDLCVYVMQFSCLNLGGFKDSGIFYCFPIILRCVWFVITNYAGCCNQAAR